MPTIEAAVFLERSMQPMTDEDFLEIAPEQYLQICQAQVTVEGEMRKYRLLNAVHVWKDSHLRALALALISKASDTKSALIVESRIGDAVVYVNGCLESEIAEIAPAVAVMMASWGWDETPTMLIQINNERLLVLPRFSDPQWVAEVGWEDGH